MDFAADFVVLVLMLVICYVRRLKKWVRAATYVAFAVDIILLIINYTIPQFYRGTQFKSLIFGVTAAGLSYICFDVVAVCVMLAAGFFPKKNGGAGGTE